MNKDTKVLTWVLHKLVRKFGDSLIYGNIISKIQADLFPSFCRHLKIAEKLMPIMGSID